MKHVCVNWAACAWIASTTFGCALPSDVTAMPEPRSMRELPSASTTTPPPAATASTGTVCPTPAATAAALRASSSCERGPGMLVTRRRSCGSAGPPSGFAVTVSVAVMVGSVRTAVPRSHSPRCTFSSAACTSRTRRGVGGSPGRWAPRARQGAGLGGLARGSAPAGSEGRMDAATEAATLRALLRRHELHLTLQGEESDLSPGALDQAVRWVHSSDLADPTPFLSEGLALLTTGRQFLEAGDEPEVFHAYVHRLSARGVVALGFGTEVVRDGIPPALAAACRDERMPLFEVPYRTPFIAVARANAEAIAAQSYARRSWALAAQRAIALAALRPDGLGATLAELARQLDTWVGMYDAAGELVREHPVGGLDAEAVASLHSEVDTVLRRGARAGSALRLGDTPFTLQTLGRGGHLRGVIAMAVGDLDQEGRGVVTAVIAMAGLALEQQQGLNRARGELRAGLVQSLLTGKPGLARRIARDLWGPLPPAPLVVALTEPSAARSEAIAELLELRVDERRGTLFFGRIDDGLVIVVHA